ncbi:MAG: NAD(P)/FAD-dependent oxidoreductase [Alphaproteobacteria bacterium]|nr:NAD(P)/FAD-dependent oxidoreductase [Rhodospirillaceae bacterium]MBT6511702.1 NAD(P)/FAD-dependent oxidoreductase [Rhodospirillaceae bacterium]MBT7614671.1 NAD(P)/FAD-dependent oxidoreductase [Rhodospirillaceae bacterium]MBT7648902.1 NAD(P)/FAD-dependent oxidoreductase [Rhodospirillaceae bacterium]MDG2480062.1 NAD(P)/FAD-dependent oxidoreductase [Alphaproteobacteria bacterium]
MADRFDVIILGGGNAGFAVSSVLHEAGKNIAFVENWTFGGTCPNRGCTPKKVLVAAAHAMHEIESAPTHGITVGEARLDWTTLIEREQGLIEAIPNSMRQLAEKRGAVFSGTARFVGPNAIDVDGTVIDGTVIEGDNIVIATGSRPRPLPIPGAEHKITSDEVLSERKLPEEVVFVGGGVIAMEFSHVYIRAGAKVTILEALPRLLPRMEKDAVDAIRAETERLGVVVKTDVTVKQIVETDGRLEVEYEHEGETLRQSATRVVNGAGRIANVDTLDLEAAGITHDRLRIEVDEHLRSVSNPAAWVAGDALVHSAQLSPVATYEGRIVGQNILNGATTTPDYNVIPSSVYTVPALSSVGLTEEEADRLGLDVKVVTSDMRGWFSSRTYGETAAFSKTLVEAGTDRIVGAHMVGHHGEELIHLFAMAMRHGITAAELRDQIHSFPTFSADIKSML